MGQRKGPWTPEEDFLLTHYIQTHGEGQWRTLPKKAGLQRCGKGCRLRWMNYLRPNVKRGNISTEEEELIIRLHKLLGNRWSLIAGRVPGRTDNEIKNYCNTRLSKKLGCKASMNKTTNVSERANATGVWKTDISNAGVNIDCMSEKHIYSVAEDLTTSSVFSGADFIVYDNLQAPYSTVNYNEYMDMTGHSTVNYNEYMDMTGHVFAGKFIYNEMDALNKTLLGDSAHIHHLPSANHEEAFWAGDLTASQHMCFGNGSDSSTPLLQQQSQGIEYEPHLVSTCIFDESNDTTNSLLNCQGIIAYEETPKPNALIERQSLDQEYLGNCFNHFLDYGKLN